MDTALTPITAFAEAIAEGQPSRFEAAVRAAYAAGASRDALLVAVEVARRAVDVPLPVIVQAYAAVQGWPREAAPEHASPTEELRRAA